MPGALHDIEPFFGWLNLYSHEIDPNSPFYQVEHNQFYYDRSMNRIPVHPLWDFIGSESLLVKILYANYDQHYAIVELFGEWNDLFENDYKLLAENCLTYFIDAGINRFIFICENVFHGYFESDDYYEALQDELEDGWICMIRPRHGLWEEMEAYNLTSYFFHSPLIDDLNWRKLKPHQLFGAVTSRLPKLLT
ncbi:MAG: hypothetical protein AAGI38_00110 [Bacteroidota bacterium]